MYQDEGALIFRRELAPQKTGVALNFPDADVTLPFPMPASGTWRERLQGEADVVAGPGSTVDVTIPSNTAESGLSAERGVPSGTARATAAGGHQRRPRS